MLHLCSVIAFARAAAYTAGMTRHLNPTCDADLARGGLRGVHGSLGQLRSARKHLAALGYDTRVIDQVLEVLALEHTAVATFADKVAPPK